MATLSYVSKAYGTSPFHLVLVLLCSGCLPACKIHGVADALPIGGWNIHSLCMSLWLPYSNNPWFANVVRTRGAC